MPETIPYITVDIDKPVFSAPETQYSFHYPSHTFIGQNTRFMSPDGTEGMCSIVAKFNFAGEIEHGSIKVVGGVESLGIPDDSILLQGDILNVDTSTQGGLFSANFLFRINQDHSLLEYTSHIGVWNSYMHIPGWPVFFHKYLFRRNWGPHSAPLNSYIGQVKNIG